MINYYEIKKKVEQDIENELANMNKKSDFDQTVALYENMFSSVFKDMTPVKITNPKEGDNTAQIKL